MYAHPIRLNCALEETHYRRTSAAGADAQFKINSLINEGSLCFSVFREWPQVLVCYLCVPESGPAAPADFGCPQKCRCRCAACLRQVRASGSGWLCSCWLLACSAYSCSNWIKISRKMRKQTLYIVHHLFVCGNHHQQ